MKSKGCIGIWSSIHAGFTPFWMIQFPFFHHQTESFLLPNLWRCSNRRSALQTVFHKTIEVNLTTNSVQNHDIPWNPAWFMGTLCSCQFEKIIPKWNEVVFWPPAAKEGIQRIPTNHHHGRSHSARPARSGQNGKVAGKNCLAFMVFYVGFLWFSHMVFNFLYGFDLDHLKIYHDLSIVYGRRCVHPSIQI